MTLVGKSRQRGHTRDRLIRPGQQSRSPFNAAPPYVLSRRTARVLPERAHEMHRMHPHRGRQLVDLQWFGEPVIQQFVSNL